MDRRDEADERPPQFFIGPETGRDPASLLDEARQRVRDEDEKNKESNKLARRLLVALLLIILLTVVFYGVMPHYGMRLPPYVPILVYLSIAAGAILTFRDSDID